MILFVQAAKMRIGLHGPVTLRLLIVGIPLSLLLGTLTAVVLLPVLPWWEAVCLAAIVAPTEVALIEALLEDRRIPRTSATRWRSRAGSATVSRWLHC